MTVQESFAILIAKLAAILPKAEDFITNPRRYSRSHEVQGTEIPPHLAVHLYPRHLGLTKKGPPPTLNCIHGTKRATHINFDVTRLYVCIFTP